MISDLAKINNFLPIIYLGHEELNAAKLTIICGKLRELQKLEYFLVLSERLHEKFKFDFVVTKSEYEIYKIYFRRACWFKEMPGADGVANFILENGLKFEKNDKVTNQPNKFCYFGKMEEFLVDLKVINKKITKFCDFNDNIDEVLERYDAVVGRESLGLLTAAHKNKKIYLLNQSNISNSFQMIFPDTVNIQL